MLVVDTGAYTKDSPGYLTYQRDNIYCGLDSAVTIEVFQKVLAKADPVALATYDFECRQSILAAVISDRGIRIDEAARLSLMFEYQNELATLAEYVIKIGKAIGLDELSYASPVQLMHAFYDVLKIPVQMHKERGKEPRPTVNEEALLKIVNYLWGRPLAKAVLACREVTGLLKVVKSGVDSDGRMRAEFEPGSVETARWASRKNALGGGTNFQNITDRLRAIFIPDEDYFFAYLDLGQAESRSTAYYADDEAYIKACEAEDLHAAVSATMWPGQDHKGIYHKWLTRRDVAKKAGHATNNAGTAYGIARKIGVEPALMEKFHKEYFAAFPGIQRRHHEMAQILQTEHCLTTVFGRRRHFFGRPWDHETLKDAASHVNQATIGDYLGISLHDIFWTYDRNDSRADVKLVAQVHDAGLFLIRKCREDLLPELQKKMSFPVVFPSGKTMVIPIYISG